MMMEFQIIGILFQSMQTVISDGDGILDRDEYNPNSTTGNPADSDGDGEMICSRLASTNATSDSEEASMNSVGGSCCYYYFF